MRAMHAVVVALCALGAGPEGPSWDFEALRQIVAELDTAARHPDVAAMDRALAEAAGRAYGQSPMPGEATEDLARRLLKQREPSHPPVKPGQWLLALVRRLYLDVAHRAKGLARFRTDRQERAWLDGRAQAAAEAAEAIGGELQIGLEGVEGFVELPPRVGGAPPTRIGAKAELAAGRLIIERLPRADFSSGAAPADAPRTRGGALREVYAALKQYDTTAKMLGRYDASWRKMQGHVQALLPGAAPALVLNELARAAAEAKVGTIHLVTLDRDGEVRELPILIHPKRARRAARSVEVGCPDGQRIDQCARRLAHAHASGAVHYQVP